MSEPDPSEPKIVVDTDWKEQVAKEREAAMAQSSAPLTAGESLAAEKKEPEDNEKPGDDYVPLAEDDLPPPPAASFEILVSMFFTQAMAMLGQIPHPTTGKPQINKPYAKHYIDTLDLLGEKTKGNLSSDEAKMLSEALHALRMMYVNVRLP